MQFYTILLAYIGIPPIPHTLLCGVRSSAASFPFQ
jgi:hypothetical protein